MQLQKLSTFHGLPVSVEIVKEDLNIDTADSDATLERMIRAAADFMEIRTGYAIAPGIYEVLSADWCECFSFDEDRRRFLLEIMRAPLRELESIEYLSAADTWTATNTVDFQVSRRPRSFVIAPLSTFQAPATFSTLDSVRIRFQAGYDLADENTGMSGEPIQMPDGLQRTLIMLVGHYYKYRELFEADNVSKIEQGMGSLLGAYRQYW